MPTAAEYAEAARSIRATMTAVAGLRHPIEGIASLTGVSNGATKRKRIVEHLDEAAASVATWVAALDADAATLEWRAEQCRQYAIAVDGYRTAMRAWATSSTSTDPNAGPRMPPKPYSWISI